MAFSLNTFHSQHSCSSLEGRISFFGRTFNSSRTAQAEDVVVSWIENEYSSTSRHSAGKKNHVITTDYYECAWYNEPCRSALLVARETNVLQDEGRRVLQLISFSNFIIFHFHFHQISYFRCEYLCGKLFYFPHQTKSNFVQSRARSAPIHHAMNTIQNNVLESH
jgi:hypothetical protein